MADNNLKKVTENRFSFIDVNDISYWGNFHEHFSGWDPKTPVLYHIEGSAGSSDSTGETTSTYTLTFKTQFGVEIKKINKVEEGDFVSYPVAPEVAGYTFSAWSQDITVMPAKNTIITAIYEANVYTLTYIIDGTEYTKEIAYQEPITFDVDPIKENYVFVEWEGMPVGQKMPIDGVTVTAKFEGKPCTIIAKYRDENGEMAEMPINVKYDDKVADYMSTPNDVETEEYVYTFTGWEPSFDEDTLVQDTEVIYEAKYDESKQEYTIDYNIISGNTTIPFTSITDQWGTEVSVELPTVAGYEFSAWEPVYEAIQVGNKTVSTNQTAKEITIKVVGEDKVITCDSPVILDAEKLNIVGYDAEYVLSPEGAASIVDGQVVMTPEQIENMSDDIEITISTTAKTVTVNILGEDVTMTCESDNIVFDMPTKAGYAVSLDKTIGTLEETEDGQVKFTLTPDEVEAIVTGAEAKVTTDETPKVVTVMLEGKDAVEVTCENPVSIGEPNHVPGYDETWKTENGSIDNDNYLHLTGEEVEALGDTLEITVAVESKPKEVNVPVSGMGEVTITCESGITLETIEAEAGYTKVYAVNPDGAATVEDGVLSMTGEQIDNIPEDIEVVINKTPNVLVINVDGNDIEFTVEDSYVYPTSAKTGYERVNKVNDEVVTDDKFELSGEAIDNAIANGTEFVITTSEEPLDRIIAVSISGETYTGVSKTDETFDLTTLVEDKTDEGWMIDWKGIDIDNYTVPAQDADTVIIEARYVKLPIRIRIDKKTEQEDGSFISEEGTVFEGEWGVALVLNKPSYDSDVYTFSWDVTEPFIPEYSNDVIIITGSLLFKVVDTNVYAGAYITNENDVISQFNAKNEEITYPQKITFTVPQSNDRNVLDALYNEIQLAVDTQVEEEYLDGPEEADRYEDLVNIKNTIDDFAKTNTYTFAIKVPVSYYNQNKFKIEDVALGSDDTSNWNMVVEDDFVVFTSKKDAYTPSGIKDVSYSYLITIK